MHKQDETAVTRLVAFVRGLLPEDWRGRAGQVFRKTTQAISTFADKHHVGPKDLLDESVGLGRRKVEGLANKEYAEAVKSFAEAEKTKVETVLQQRSSESKVRQEEATARLSELTVLEKELELLKKFKDIGVIPYRDENGNLTVLPLPPNRTFSELGGLRKDDSVLNLPPPGEAKTRSRKKRPEPKKK